MSSCKYILIIRTTVAPPLSHQRNFNRVLCYVTDNNCAPFISRLVIHGRASVAIRHATRKVNPLVIAVKGSWENGLAITLRLKKKGGLQRAFFPKKFDVISKFQAAPTPRENFNRSVKCQGNFSSSRSTREFRYCAEGRREMEREREMQGLSRCFIHSPPSCPQAISLLRV